MRKLLKNMFRFLIEQRQSGTTTLLKTIAANNDVWVLVPDQQTKGQFNGSAITLDELDRMGSKSHKPILVDNYTMIKLCELVDVEIIGLDNAISERENLIEKMEDLIKQFRRTNKAKPRLNDFSQNRSLNKLDW